MLRAADVETGLDTALSRFQELVSSCPPSIAGMRVGDDSRTVTALVNNVADGLRMVAALAPELKKGTTAVPDEVLDELSARYGKAAAGRDWEETVAHLTECAAQLRSALKSLGERAAAPAVQALVARCALDRIRLHAAAIEMALKEGGTGGD